MATVTSRALAATLNPADPTLGAVLGALRFPAPEEDRWAASIEAARVRLEASDEMLRFPIRDRSWWQRAIAASSDPEPPVLHEDHVARALGEITRVTSKPPNWGRFLFRVVRRLRPERCLELGTSVGMSGSYIGSALIANDLGSLLTLEGEEASARIARAVFDDVGVAGRLTVRVGRFEDALDDAIESLGRVDLAFIDGHHQYEPTLRYFDAIQKATPAGGLLVFDDVTYDLGDMESAWREIRAHPRVTGSLTVGNVGFAVIDGQRTEHRRLRRLPVSPS